MNIRSRMIVGIIGAIAFILMSNLVAQYMFGQTSSTIQEMVGNGQKKLTLIAQLKDVVTKRAVLQRELVILTDENQFKQTRDHLNDNAEEIAKLFTAIEESDLNDQEKAYIAEVRANVVSANEIYGSFVMAIEEDFREDAVEILLKELVPKYQMFSKLVAEFDDYEQQKMQNSGAHLLKEQSIGQQLLWAVLIASILIFSIAGYFVAQSFLRPIDAMRKAMDRISETGELSYQVPVLSKDELGKTAEDINHLLKTISEAINDVNQMMQDVAEGKFDRKIEHDYKGNFRALKEGVNTSAEQVFNMVVVLRGTSNGLKNGTLKPVENEKIDLKGDYCNVVQDLNSAMIAMSLTVQDISQTLNSLAHGDFSRRVTVDARGEFVNLKDSINTTLEALESFVEDVATTQTRISEGDLTSRVEGTYQGKMAILKDSLNVSSQNISVMIAKVSALTKLVASESEGIAHGSSEIAERIQLQSASLEQTSSRMVEMTQLVKNNADNSLAADGMAREASQKLNSGVSVMEKALLSMDAMSEASQKINDIITIIDSIAFQTNLLALNAAVEAARAGEHGRGFAVVAGEVRNLAGKSAEAASEIKQLIENSVRISHESGDYVQQVSEALVEVNQSMESMSQMIATITSASAEQSDGIQSVSGAVSEMDTTTQQNAGLVEEAASGSQDLRHQADELLKLVAGFKVDDKIMRRMERMQHSETAKQFEKMIEAHLAWKGKIRAFVDGMDIGVTYEAATDHTACILGKWYYGEGQVYMNLPLMRQLGDEHMEMHQGIKKVMDAKSVGDKELVEDGLAQVDRQSEKVVMILNQLIDEVA